MGCWIWLRQLWRILIYFSKCLRGTTLKHHTTYISVYNSILIQFITQYRIVPKSNSGHLWQFFLPMRQTSATKRTTGHDPCSFLFRLDGTNLRSSFELPIDCVILNCGIPMICLDKQKYVWEIKLTRTTRFCTFLVLEMNYIFLRVMEVWTQWVPAKLTWRPKGVTYFARAPLC